MSLIELAKVRSFDALVKGFSHALPLLTVRGGFSKEAVLAGIGVGLGFLQFEDSSNINGDAQPKENNKYYSHGKPYGR